MKYNPLEKFKNEYAGEKAIDDITEDARKQLLRTYQRTYDQIFKDLVNSRKNLTYFQIRKREKLFKHIGNILANNKKIAGNILKDKEVLIAKLAAHDAIFLLPKNPNKSKEFHFKYAENYVNQTFSDTYRHIAAMTGNMRAEVKNMLREEAAKISRKAAIEGITRKAAYRQLQTDLLAKEPDFVFIDRSGRKWRTDKYIDMLTKTLMHNTYRENLINTVSNEGQDLVKVSVHGTVCPYCLPYEGKVLSITGASRKYFSVDEAKANKLFHPNCKHRLLPYDGE